jgi:hypothetical protein
MEPVPVCVSGTQRECQEIRPQRQQGIWGHPLLALRAGTSSAFSKVAIRTGSTLECEKIIRRV